MADAARQSVTGDAFLGGRLRLRQPVSGHRAGTDAILLAAAAPAAAEGPALDAGAGVGAAGLSLAALRPGLVFGLIEIDPALASLARDNIESNGFAGRGEVFRADLIDPQSRRAAGLGEASARLVISNPPFLDPRRTRPSPDAGKRVAHMMAPGVTLEDWIRSCFALLMDGGLLLMIHRPEALADMLAAARRWGGDITLLPIHPQADKGATRILLRAKKGGRGPLAIAPPLILHAGGRFTPEAEAIHRGQSLISW